MRNGDINIALIVETIVNEFELENILSSGNGYSKSFIEIKKQFPNCSSEEIYKIIKIACDMYSYKKDEKSELILTAPNSFKLKVKKTRTAINELITSAQKSIILTGYSISDYFTEMLDVILDKSKKGIYVSLYINDVEKHKIQLDKLLLYAGKYIKIYNYNKNNDDKMAALHAKLIIVDNYKSFISSANLSYHGMEGNIEMGILLESEKKAKDIEEIFKVLRVQKVFEKYKL
jgi:phosphatidylserine/phosphatidylglycerophosphate/cardiolipin synthase-like enzyme